MDGDELELFRGAVERAVASGRDLDDALEELGWADAFAADERSALSVLFETQGAAAATSGALNIVIASLLGVDVGATVVLPGGVALGLGEAARFLSEVDGQTLTAVVPRGALTVRSIRGIDPAAGLSAVEIPTTGLDWESAPGTWGDALAAARRALAHEEVGAMRTMLRLAREHALERIQFGRPISSFQAVRHHLAEALVAIEAADAALDGAWIDGTPFAAAVAKAVAGSSAQVVRRKCQQVLAGIGFTTEHDLHRYVRRSMLLDALLGDAATLTDEIGAELIAAATLPGPVPL